MYHHYLSGGSVMPKRSSEKNICLKAASILAAVLLCLGGFFVFSGCAMPDNGTKVDNISANAEKTYYIKEENSHISLSASDVSAKSAILIEASSGEVLWSKNADQRLPMASTTKIMTALVAIENGDVGRTVSVSPEAVGVEGSSVYLYPNEKMTLGDLIYAMLLESANDAAAAIAIEVGGSIEGFAKMMNQKAENLGLRDTHFENPHGLDGETHYTTAHELAIIAREAYSNDTLKSIFSTYKKTIPLNETEGVRLLINHNKLLKSYEGATGIKTGFTKKSGRCLVSAAERGGLSLIAVTLNAPNDWQDHKNMLDHGFSLIESKTLCTAGEYTYAVAVSGGKDDHVIVKNSDTVRLILPRNGKKIEYKIELPRFLYAPVQEGEVVGRIAFYLDGKEIASSDLVTASSVDKFPIKKRIFDFFKF